MLPCPWSKSTESYVARSNVPLVDLFSTHIEQLPCVTPVLPPLMSVLISKVKGLCTLSFDIPVVSVWVRRRNIIGPERLIPLALSRSQFGISHLIGGSLRPAMSCQTYLILERPGAHPDGDVASLHHHATRCPFATTPRPW